MCSSLIFPAFLCFSPSWYYKMLFSATETMQKMYWPWVSAFDTQDVSNRSCAISHLLRLPFKADLSCLQAIFKLWAPETYGAMGKFIITALHLSDLIQACQKLCESMAYIYTMLQQTRANPTIHTLTGLMAGRASIWRIPIEILGSIYSAHHLWRNVSGIKKEESV